MVAKEPNFEVNIFRCPPSTRKDFNRAVKWFGFSSFTDAMKYLMREFNRVYREEENAGKTGSPPRLYAGDVSHADGRRHHEVAA